MEMTEKLIKQVQRCATTNVLPTDKQHSFHLAITKKGELTKAVSMDSGEAELFKKTRLESIKRRSVRKRTSKRSDKPEPGYGQDTEAYEKIRERVLQERAVTNAIDALQERWKMLTFMYEDCVKLNQRRKEQKLKKLNVQRQFELITLVSTFILFCLFLSIFIVLLKT